MLPLYTSLADLHDQFLKPLLQTIEFGLKRVSLDELKPDWDINPETTSIESPGKFFSVEWVSYHFKAPWRTWDWKQPLLRQGSGNVGLIFDEHCNALLRIVLEPGNIDRGFQGGPALWGPSVQYSLGKILMLQKTGDTLPFIDLLATHATKTIEVVAPGDGARVNKQNRMFVSVLPHALIEQELECLGEKATEYVLVSPSTLREIMTQYATDHLRETLSIVLQDKELAEQWLK